MAANDEFPREWTAFIGPATWNNNNIVLPAIAGVAYVIDSAFLKGFSVDASFKSFPQLFLSTSDGKYTNLILLECVLPASSSTALPSIDSDSQSFSGLVTGPGASVTLQITGADANVGVWARITGHCI